MLATEEIREMERAPGISITVPSRRLLGDCPLCRSLEAAYQARVSEYAEARASASYAVSKKLAAQKNVEMERARYELEEHRLDCVIYRDVPRQVQSEIPEKLGRLVA